MAHQTEIVINGVTTEVTEFDHTAQEIDDGIDNLHTLTGGATTPQVALANLGALFAIAAAAAYNSSGTYAIGDYCTNDGNLYKCNTPIESGETWTEAHWTTTTVAAELAELSSQLSNKMGLITLPTQDLSNAPAQPFIALTGTSDVTGLPEGWPQSRNDFVRFWCGNLAYTLDFIANYANKKLAYRLAEAKWAEIATATPPQRYGLPLENGFSANGTCKYFKTQENIVNLSGGVTGSFPANQDTKIGTLPEGFRPSGTCRRGAVTSAGTAYIEIRADGSVWIHPFNSAGTYAFFDADFIAIS